MKRIFNSGFYSDRAYDIFEKYIFEITYNNWKVYRENDGEIMLIAQNSNLDGMISRSIFHLKDIDKRVFKKMDLKDGLIVFRKFYFILHGKPTANILRGGWEIPESMTKESVQNRLSELIGSPLDMIQTESIAVLKEAWKESFEKNETNILNIKVEYEKNLMAEKARYTEEKQKIIEEYLAIIGKDTTDKKEIRKARLFFGPFGQD